MPDPHSYQAIGWGIVMLASLCVAINQIMGIVDRVKGKETEHRQISPQPLQVSIPESCATKASVDALANNSAHAQESLWSKIGGVERGANQRMDGLRLEMKADFAAVQHRINDLAEEMPKKIIELLKVTGQLKS